MWRNLRPFYKNFTSHRALKYRHQSHTTKSVKTFLTVYRWYIRKANICWVKDDFTANIDIWSWTFSEFFYQLLVRSLEGMDDLPTLLKILIKFLLTNLEIYFTVAKLSKQRSFYNYTTNSWLTVRFLLRDRKTITHWKRNLQ